MVGIEAVTEAMNNRKKGRHLNAGVSRVVEEEVSGP